jgi:hypothetical protein
MHCTERPSSRMSAAQPTPELPTSQARHSLRAATGSAAAIELETLEYAAQLCRRSEGLAIQAAWKIEAIIKRLSQQNAPAQRPPATDV